MDQAQARQPITADEVQEFVGQLNQFRETLGPRQRDLFDAMVMAAANGTPSDVQGYDDNANWIFPVGWVDDVTWIRLSRECRIRGGIEEVLGPSGFGARLW